MHHTQEQDRAAEMLRIAAKYIEDNYDEGIIHYDGADCDGACVADDCRMAAADLDGQPTEYDGVIP